MYYSNVIKKIMLAGALLYTSHTYAVIYPTLKPEGRGIDGCTGTRNCTAASYGIDLNEGAGYSWSAPITQSGKFKLFFRISVASGTRKMGVWVNNTKVNVLSATSTDSPRTSGREIEISATLNSGTNSIELRDSEGTLEFDAFHLRVEPELPFTGADIGGVAKPGSVIYSNNKYTINASGLDIFGQSDQLHFLSAPLNGDGDLIANIESVTEPDNWAKVGLMIRNGQTAAAQNVFMFMRPSQGSGFQYRKTQGDWTDTTWIDNPQDDISLTEWTSPTKRRVRYLKPSKWLRLTKSGNKVSAYSSNDGKCWIARWNQNITFSNNNLLAGVALTSHTNNSLATAVVSGLEIRPTAPKNMNEVNKDCDRAQVDGRVAAPTQWITPPSNLGISNWSYTLTNPSPSQRPVPCIAGDTPENRRLNEYDLVCPASSTSAPWANLGFTYDQNWIRGKSMGFGLNNTSSPTSVAGKEIWLRGEVSLSQEQIDNLVFWGRWADGASIFVNGQSATSFHDLGNYKGLDFYLGLSPSARKALKPGINVFAIYARCDDCVKAAILDFGIGINSKMANLPITNRVSTPGTKEAKFGDLVIDFAHRMGAIGGLGSAYKDHQLVESVAVGWRDISLREPMARDSIIRFSSSDKRLLEAMLVNLYNENGLDPDAKVFGENGVLSHIKPYNNLWGTGVLDVTVDMLRLGTSGLPDTGDQQTWIDETAFKMGIHTKDFDIDARMRYLVSLNTTAIPGTKNAYSNLAFTVIQAIRKKITGKTTAEYFEQDMGFPGVVEAGENLSDRPGDLGKKVGYQLIGMETNDRWVALSGALAASTDTILDFLQQYAPSYERIGNTKTFERRSGSHGANMEGTRGGLNFNPIEGKGTAQFWNSDYPGTKYWEFAFQVLDQGLDPGSCNPTENSGRKYRIQNYWRPKQFLMTEPLAGSTTPSFGIRELTNTGAESAKWNFTPVLGSPGYFMIKNAWGSDNPHTLVQRNGLVAAMQGISDTDTAAHWKLDGSSGKYFLIENRSMTNSHLNFENERLQLSASGDGTHSARWWICN